MHVSQLFGHLRSLSWCPALLLLYIAAVYLQLLVVDLLFSSCSSRNNSLFCFTMPLRLSLVACRAQFVVHLIELCRLLMARDMLPVRLFCSCAVHTKAVVFLLSMKLPFDGFPAAAPVNLAPAVLCVVVRLLILR